MAINKLRTKSDFGQIDEILNITKKFTIPSSISDTLDAQSEKRPALLFNETTESLRIFVDGVWQNVNGGNKRTNLEYILVNSSFLVTKNSAGVALYINNLPTFLTLPNDFWKVYVTDTHQIFELNINDTYLGVGGTQLDADNLFEYGKYSNTNLLQGEEFQFDLSNTEQIFTLETDKSFDEIIMVLVNGVFLSRNQYNYITPNKIQIIDELEVIDGSPDFVTVVSGRILSPTTKKGVFDWGFVNTGTSVGVKTKYKDYTPELFVNENSVIVCSAQCDYTENRGENYSVSAQPLPNGNIRFRLTSLDLNTNGNSKVVIPFIIF